MIVDGPLRRGQITAPGANAAKAGNFNETFSVSAYPASRDGKVSGCVLEFSGSANDWAYKNGAPISYMGSVMLNLVNKNGKVLLVPTAKLKISDVTIANGDVKLVPFTPSAISLLDEHKYPVGAAVASFEVEGGGGRFSTYRLDDSWISVQKAMLDTNTLGLTFNRTQGGLDVRLSVDLSIHDSVSKQGNGDQSAVHEWLRCQGDLIDLADQ